MPRMRTIEQAAAELKAADPGTALTKMQYGNFFCPARFHVSPWEISALCAWSSWKSTCMGEAAGA